ncbi:MAG TPA: alpha/beta fold hydrolase [Chlamydiales bacterium]|nr:alpha/beta fold hydrolase [Chlamydiales bacterium]
MEKGSNYLSSVILLCGSLLASGIYMIFFHFYPAASLFFFYITVVFAGLGLIKVFNEAAHRFSSPLNRVVYWIHSIIFETFAVIFTLFIKPFGKGNWAACGPKEGRPILLVHGYMQNASNWAYLKRALCQKGLGPIYTLNLKHPFRSIRDYALMVAEKAETIRQETGRPDLSLIGHSMGGLVSAWYAAQIALPGRVTDVITIGSPIGGTRLAAIAIGPNGREMELGSHFVKALQQGMQQKTKTKFFHIASTTDQVIIPQSSAWRGFHPKQEYLVDDLGHMSLLFSPRIAEKIWEWAMHTHSENGKRAGK